MGWGGWCRKTCGARIGTWEENDVAQVTWQHIHPDLIATICPFAHLPIVQKIYLCAAASPSSYNLPWKAIISMSPKRIGPIAQAWYKWKALRLPWRKRFLVGTASLRPQTHNNANNPSPQVLICLATRTGSSASLVVPRPNDYAESSSTRARRTTPRSASVRSGTSGYDTHGKIRHR